MFSLTQQSYLMLVLLGIGGFLGNYFHLPLFFGIDFIFGSVAVLLIIYLFGVGWGTLSALLVSNYTVFLWGHPGAMVVLTLEALFIGLTWRRYTQNLLLLEGIFWGCLGGPLTLLINLFLIPHDGVLHILILLKVVANGMVNAAIAGLLITYLPLSRWAHRAVSFYPSLHQILLNFIVTLVLLPSLIIITINGWQLSRHLMEEIHDEFTFLSTHVSTFFRLSHQKYTQAIHEFGRFAELANIYPSSHLEQQIIFMLEQFPEFSEVVFTDSQGHPWFVFPYSAKILLANQGTSQEFFSVPQTKILSVAQKTYLVYMLSIEQGIKGKVYVYIDIENLTRLYYDFLTKHRVQLALTDNPGRILHRIHFDWTSSSRHFYNHSSPSLIFPNTEAILARWRNAIYVQRFTLEDHFPLQAVIEIPLREPLDRLLKIYINKLSTIAIIVLLGLILGMIVSRRLVKPLVRLAHITDNLSTRLERNPSLIWPESHINEINSLITNFKSMSQSLQTWFEEAQNTRNCLEQRVQMRTKELHHERALLRNLINSLPDIIFYKDCYGVYLGCNKAFEEFIGCSEAQLIGKTDFELFPKKMATFFLEQEHQTLVTCQLTIDEGWIIYPEGRRVLLEIIRTPFFASTGEMLGLIGTGRDITVRKKVEEELRQSQEMLRLVINSIPQYIFWKNKDSIYLGCNQNFAMRVGLSSPEDIVGKTDEDLNQCHPLFTPFFQTINRYMKADGKTEYQSVESLQLEDGTRLWLEMNKISLKDDFGQVIGVLGCFEDITDLKHVNEKLKQATKVLESSAEAIVITDAKTQIIAINKAFTQITGYTEREVLGKMTSLLKSGKQNQEFYEEMWDSISLTGRWEGEIWNRRKNGEIYPAWLHISVIKEEIANFITNYLAIFSDITSRKQTEQQLAYLAHYDDLTGLPNRSLFYERVALAISHVPQPHGLIAIMFLDLDRFKYINDTWGHVVGDLLLKQVAHRLTECLNKTDTVARLGGDDFTILLEEINHIHEIEHTAKKILDALQISFDLKGHETFMSVSIGISLYPNDGTDIDTLLKNADAAMYRAKEVGGNNYQFFEAQMNLHVHKRLTLESKLRHALERDEFLLYYQPQVHLASGTIVGAEVLLRWQHPELGLVQPYTFIPLAEETGLIIPIGEWVLYRSCLQHQYWRNNGQPLLRVSVNLSSRQFRQEDLSKQVIQIVEKTNIDPTMLELEITESMLMQDADKAAKTLHNLKDHGIQITIDDFGTGYSSLSYLKRFPIDKLKIDQSFIRDIPTNKEDMTITRAIVALARSLNLKVIAEGVETRSQMAFLRSLKCDEVQGYLISRPIPEEEFLKLINRPEGY